MQDLAYVLIFVMNISFFLQIIEILHSHDAGADIKFNIKKIL